MTGFSGTCAVERHTVKNRTISENYWLIDAGGRGRWSWGVIEKERTKCEDRFNAMTQWRDVIKARCLSHRIGLFRFRCSPYIFWSTDLLMPTLCQRKKNFRGLRWYFSIPTIGTKCCEANNSTDLNRFYPLELLTYECQRYANRRVNNTH